MGRHPSFNNVALKVTDDTTLYPSTTAEEKFGFCSLSVVVLDQILSVTVISPGGTGGSEAQDMIAALNATVLNPVAGEVMLVLRISRAIQAAEGERLLTHLIFPAYLQIIRKTDYNYVYIDYFSWSNHLIIGNDAREKGAFAPFFLFTTGVLTYLLTLQSVL